MEKTKDERNKTVWRIVGSLIAVAVFFGAILILNSCGGGGGGSEGPKVDNSDQNQNNPPADDNKNPPPDNNTNPPPDIKTAGLIQLPKTGQTVSYAKGDDGDIQAGASWPSSRFIDNGNNTVTDNLTGLMWMKKPITSKVTTLGAAIYVDKINRGFISTGTSYIDWRIPNVYELRSVSDFSKIDVMLPASYFPDINNGLYWTSTTMNIITLAANIQTGLVERLDSNYYYTIDLEKADLWLVRGLSTGLTAVPKTGQKICYGPDEGSTHQINCGKRIGWIVQEKSSCYYKWKNGSSEHAIEIPCDGARQDGQYQAGIAWPNPRLIDNGDNTVTDKLTGLMWVKNSRLKADATWQQALDYTDQMNKDKKFGYSDWRLPNINELFSVIDCSGTSCAIYPPFQYPQGSGSNHWSSTTYAGDVTRAWYWTSWLFEVGMHHGSKSATRDVWPVRTMPAK